MPQEKKNIIFIHKKFYRLSAIAQRQKKSRRHTRGTYMRVLSNKSCSHNMCVEETLALSAIAQRQKSREDTREELI